MISWNGIGLGLLASVLLTAGCSVPGQGTDRAGSTPAAPPSTASMPLDGPPSPPPTPTTLPPQLEQVDTAVSTNQENSVTDDGTTQYAVEMLQNADRVWSAWFRQLGYPEPYVFLQLIQPGVPYTNQNCRAKVGDQIVTTFASDYPNAMYCDAPNGQDKGIIIIPVRALAKLWTGDIYGRRVEDVKAIGDFAAGAVITHEFGHHIGAELAEDKGIAPQARGKNKELLADCFAGVHAYALSLGIDGRLDPGDVDEALAALAALGDASPAAADPHGTPAERRSAFLTGMNGTAQDTRGGVPNTCLKAYWPEAAWVE